ncbi:MAG TPA: alpha/beta hydrolase [Azospirillaceae bacterium]|nr:alpha/beta hydrolase [Azospirillaceae bacterium]
MALIYHVYDQAGLDAQYNMRLAVPGCQTIFDRWESESAATRARLPVRQDLRYGSHDLETLDLFPAVGSGRRAPPLLVFIHGGYWFAFDKRYFSYLAAPWVECGVAVAAINYALCPHVTMDEIVRQNRAAVAWLGANAADLGFDPARILVTGHSAGGHLTAMVLSDAGRPKGVVGGLAISGLFDLEPIRLSYLNQHLHLDAATARRNSPLHVLPAASPPLLLAVGGDETDEFQRQQADYHAAWASRGLPAEVIPMPGTHHFSVVDKLADPEGPMFATARGLLMG